jgi:hypothetical protein
MIAKTSLKEEVRTVFENFKSAITKHADVNKKRADGGWTVAEIANHIIKSTKLYRRTITKTNRPYDQNATAIRDLFLNFSLKFPTAPPLHPDAKLYSKEELFTSLDQNREAILRMIENDDLTEVCADIELPLWGALTKYEWLILFENHTMRHTKQINDFNAITRSTVQP